MLLAGALRATSNRDRRALFLLVNYTHAVKTAITSSIPRCVLLAMRTAKRKKKKSGRGGEKREKEIMSPEATRSSFFLVSLVFPLLPDHVYFLFSFFLFLIYRRLAIC